MEDLFLYPPAGTIYLLQSCDYILRAETYSSPNKSIPLRKFQTEKAPNLKRT